MKYKKRTAKHKKLLNLFNNLSDIVLTDKTLKSESQENKNENKNENEYENEYKNEDEYENEDEKEDNDDDDETMSQSEKNKIIKDLNDNFDEIIDKSKLFEEQVELLKKLEDLKGYCSFKDYDGKELKSNYFKIKLADMSNEIDEKLFEQIFGHTLIKLADKLINKTNKEENQIIVKNIEKNKDKLLKIDDFNDWVIRPNDQRINLLYTAKLILNFNETIQLDLV